MRRMMTASLALALLLAVVAFARATAPGPLGPDPHEADVREAVQAYFDGMMTGEVALLERAFHPAARLLGTGDDGLMVIPFENWAERVPNWAPGAAASGYTNRILEVDIAGNAAVAKTELIWPDVRYIDYLSLLQVDGEWKIVNKIWMEERPADRS